jgi:hypothetical protein
MVIDGFAFGGIGRERRSMVFVHQKKKATRHGSSITHSAKLHARHASHHI